MLHAAISLNPHAVAHHINADRAESEPYIGRPLDVACWVRWLEWNDPNGCYDGSEGLPEPTLAEAVALAAGQSVYLGQLEWAQYL